MRTVFRQLVVVLVGALAVGCGDAFGPITSLPRDLSLAERMLVDADNRFAFKLFREINNQEDPDKNVFISPLSAAMALGMTYNGAAGTTQEAMQQTLELEGLSLQEVNESYRSLIDLLRNLDPRVEFLLANSIWYRQGLTPLEEFLDINRTYFDAEVAGLDFSNPSATDRINQWVSDNTRDKITDIIDEIPFDVVMYLINAIYFKGDWTYQFDRERTQDAPFRLSNGSETTVKMMSHDRTLTVAARFGPDGVAIVDLPYGGAAYSMTVLLPREPTGTTSLIEDLTQERWNTWIAELDSTRTFVSLPKFTLEYELVLNDVLQALGMGEAFSPSADFSRMYESGGVWIDEVRHKTFVEVNEEGTEAAAVTSVSMATSAPPEFRVDHPFVFVIRERYSGTILFMGKIMDPAA